MLKEQHWKGGIGGAPIPGGVWGMTEHGVVDKVRFGHSLDWMISEVFSNLELFCDSVNLLMPKNGTVPQGQAHGQDLPTPTAETGTAATSLPTPDTDICKEIGIYK